MRQPRQDLVRLHDRNARLSQPYIVLLTCAALIATIGLLRNNAGVVIGAMVIAPLMNPIQSLSFALASNDRRLCRRSLLTVVVGIGLTVLTAAAISAVLPLDVVGREVLSRTRPTVSDLVVALTAGAAAAYAQSRPDLINSIAGVAIAVALVPPLCAAGIAMGTGSAITTEFGLGLISGWEIMRGSFLLFASNVLGILSASCAVLLLLLAIVVPLSRLGRLVTIESIVAKTLRDYRAETAPGQPQSKVRLLRVAVDGERALVLALLQAPEGVVTKTYLAGAVNTLSTRLKRYGINEVDVRAEIGNVKVLELSSKDPGHEVP